MGTEPGYQGWENYETWLVALWISNDEEIYRRWQERADEVRSEHDKADDAKFALAEELATSFEDGASELLASGTVYADLMTAALGEVDWPEVAEDVMGDRLKDKRRKKRA